MKDSLNRRQQLQSQLYLEQLYKGVSILLECDKEYHVLTSFYNSETESFCRFFYENE